MIVYSLDEEKGILHVRPLGPLAKEDFQSLASVADPYIEKAGSLVGLILEIEKFPGWEDFGAAVQHFRFVRGHHRKVKKIAVVTDSMVGGLAEHLTSHFIAAEVRHFGAGRMAAAREWILGNGEGD